MFKYFWVRLFIAIFSAALPMNASAISCNQASPNLSANENSYFDITEAKPLTRRQIATISKFFSSIAGRELKGTGKIIECTGPENAAKKVFQKETLLAQIGQQSGGEIIIALDTHNLTRKIKYNETLRYFGLNNEYHVDKLTGNEIIISYKLRKKRIFHEEITHMSITGRSLVIKVTRYIGGYFAVQHIRELRL